MFNRAAILHTAHTVARRRVQPCHSQRYGDTWCPKARRWMPKATYRAIFAAALRTAWADAKTIARFAAYEAEIPAISDEVSDRVAAMRADAWYEPISAAGNDRMSAILAEASAIEQAARAAAMGALR